MKDSENYQSCARRDIYLHLKYLHLWHRVKDYMSFRRQDRCQSKYSITSQGRVVCGGFRLQGQCSDRLTDCNECNTGGQVRRDCLSRGQPRLTYSNEELNYLDNPLVMLGMQSARRCEDI